MTFFFSWGKRAAHNRAQIVYYMAENLELRRSEFSQRLCDMTGCSQEEASKEVDIAIQRLFYWGAYADKYGGTVQVGVRINQLMLTRIPCCTKFLGSLFLRIGDLLCLAGTNFCD